MKCSKCNCTAMIANSKMTFEGDDSPNKETKAFNNLTYVCTNLSCDLYGGGKDSEGKCMPLDLDKPTVILEVLKQSMN